MWETLKKESRSDSQNYSADRYVAKDAFERERRKQNDYTDETSWNEGYSHPDKGEKHGKCA